MGKLSSSTDQLAGMNSTTTEPVPTVMIVEDAPEFVQLVEASLTRDGSYRIEVATNGLDAIDLARKVEPDVVILDLGLPGVDGIEVCREIRTFSDAYILMLTARAEEVDRLVGLAVGADDYVTKPFSARELAARVQVLLRRPRVSKAADDRGAPSDMVEIGAMRIDLPAREVVVDDQPVQLTKIEFDLLATLASRPGMVFTRQVLLEAVWGIDWVGDDHLVSVHIANLRKKIDRDGTDRVTTVRGVGYRLNAAS